MAIPDKPLKASRFLISQEIPTYAFNQQPDSPTFPFSLEFHRPGHQTTGCSYLLWRNQYLSVCFSFCFLSSLIFTPYASPWTKHFFKFWDYFANSQYGFYTGKDWDILLLKHCMLSGVKLLTILEIISKQLACIFHLSDTVLRKLNDEI